MPPKVGIEADRGCTDILAWLLLIGLGVGMFYVAKIAMASGDPDRLLYGTDYMGNICGKSSQKNVPNSSALAGRSWANLKYLWFPITNFTNINPTAILRSGICVAACPKFSVSLTLTFPPKLASVTDYTLPSKTFPVYFSSSPFYYRCVPDVASTAFDAATTANMKQIQPLLDVASQGYDLVASIAESWPVLVFVGICAFLLSFGVMFLLRMILRPTIYFMMLAILALLSLAAYGFVTYASDLEAATAANTPKKDTASTYRVIGWVFAGIAGAYVLLLVWFWKRIQIAIEVTKEASKVVNSAPGMLVVVPLCALVSLVVWSYCMFIALYIETAQELKPSGITYGSNVEGQVLQDTNGKNYLHIVNIFSYFWVAEIVNGIAFMSLAFVGVAWYFSAPGDNKSTPLGIVTKGFWYTLRYHIGTVTIGALFLAIIQTLQVLLEQFKKRLEQSMGKDKAAFISKVAACCLECLRRMVDYINRNTYIICCIEGKSFFPGAVRACSLLMDNIATVGAVTMVSHLAIILGKMLITCSNVVIVWALLTKTDVSPDLNVVAMCAIAAAVGYFVSTIFMQIFSVQIDVVFLCFCYDKEACQSMYMSTALANIIGVSRPQQQQGGGGGGGGHTPAMQHQPPHLPQMHGSPNMSLHGNMYMGGPQANPLMHINHSGEWDTPMMMKPQMPQIPSFKMGPSFDDY